MVVAYEAAQTANFNRPPAPERFIVPTVTGIYPVDRGQLKIPSELAPARITSFDVSDPYLEYIDPAVRGLIRAHEDMADSRARARFFMGAWSREPGTAYTDSDGNPQEKNRSFWGDPVSSREFFEGEEGLNDPALSAWQTLVPRASALRYLADPFGVTAVIGANGQPVPATEKTRIWLAACTDARSIRSRGAGLSMLGQEYIGLFRNRHHLDEFSAMSVACGTALPTLQAMMVAGVPNTRLHLIDVDKRAMAETGTLAQEIGFTGQLDPEQLNIFDPETMAALKARLTANGIDNRPWFVDAMGIFEYTSEKLRPVGKEDDPSLLYDPVEFLRTVYDLVHPGGRLVFGQMRDDRPNPDFTMGVVRWPYVCMRSPKEVMEIIVKAGIDPSCVKLSLTPDGVYTLVAIDKPEEPSAALSAGRHAVRWGIPSQQRRRPPTALGVARVAATSMLRVA